MQQPAEKRVDLLIPAALCAVWIAIQWQHLQLDPWIDELYTLRNFVFVPLRESLADYHVPNNHILLSVLLNIWRRIAGIRDLHSALNHIAVLRILPLCFSTAGIWILYRTGLRLGGRPAALMAGILLMSTVPYYNYGAQLRGYGPCVMLAAALISELLRPRQRPLVVCLLVAALLWTLPSNLYFLVAIAGASLALPADRHTRRRAALGIAGGIALGTALYLPVWREVAAYNASRPSGASLAALTRTAPVVAWQLLSGRWLLLLLPLAYLAVRCYHRSFGLPERLTTFGLLVFGLPFIFSAIRGDGAPDRIYLTALPALCIAWGVAAGRAITALKSILRLGAGGLYILLAAFALLRGEWAGTAKALSDRIAGTRCADLYFQYYLHDFRPRAKARAFVRAYPRDIPVLNVCCMDTELPKYLELAGVTLLTGDSLNAIAAVRRDVFAVIDGPQMCSGNGLAVPLRESPSAFSWPTVTYIRWSSDGATGAQQ